MTRYGRKVTGKVRATYWKTNPVKALDTLCGARGIRGAVDVVEATETEDGEWVRVTLAEILPEEV